MRHSKLTFLTLLILLYSFPTHARDFTYDGITYTILDADAKTCKTKDGDIPTAGNICSGDITIPSVVSDGLNDYTVIAIGVGAFYNCVELTSIVLPECVTSIGKWAFDDCSSLTSINIPDGVTSIENYTFYNCSSLNSIILPHGVTSIAQDAFSGCSSLTSIILPDSMTSIGDGAFYGCSSLTSINIPDGVTSIEGAAFYNCSSLTSINIPAGVTSIEGLVFAGCFNLTSINIPIDVTSIGRNAFEGCSSLTSINIPDGVTTIEGYAFYNCSSLTSINIPGGVTSIGVLAFNNCNNLEEVTYDATTPIEALENAFGYTTYETATLKTPNATLESVQATVPWNKFTHIIAKDGSIVPPLAAGDDFEYEGIIYTVIDADAKTCKTKDGYYDSMKLTGIPGNTCEGTVTIPSVVSDGTTDYSVTSIGWFAFSNCTNLNKINLPASISSIGSNAFEGCSSLSSIILPDGVTSINNYTFHGCHNLKVISIPDGVTSIGSAAFEGCFSLMTIKIPEGVTSIGSDAFRDCSSLTSIKIPAGVTVFGSYGFLFCENLEEITYYASIPVEAPENLFQYLYGSATLKTPNATLATVQATAPWNKFSHVIASDGRFGLGLATGEDFEYEGITYTVLDADAKTCQTKAGTYDSELSKYIAGNNCSGDITIPSVVSDGTNDYTVTNIGYNAFYECSELTSIILPETVSSIGKYAFYGCSKLTSISIPEGVTSIEKDAFRSCTNLISINIPKGVTSIEEGTFWNCSSLTSINIPNGVTSIGDNAFLGCSSLTSINIPDGVTSIEWNAFASCSSLTSIHIPDAVTSIRGHAFSNCSKLTSINIPEGVSSLGEMVFYDCTGLTSIILPDGVTYIGSRAFMGCSNLASINIPEGLTSIEYNTFFGCSSLNSINIPEGVTSIGNGTFYGCSGLTSINIPNSVSSIEDETFYGCSGLTSINIPNSVTSIGHNAFRNCTGLTSINIPDAVTSIGDWAFDGCSGLTFLILPDRVSSFGNFAFSGCNNLEEIIYAASIPEEAPWDIFGSNYVYIYGTATLNTPNATLADVQATEPWNMFKHIVASDGSIGQELAVGDDFEYEGIWYTVTDTEAKTVKTKDGNYNNNFVTTAGNTVEGDIVIPSKVSDGTNYYTVTAVGNYAFYKCSGLISISIPDGITYIGESAFQGCSVLSSINIPDGVTSIGSQTFEDCFRLNSINIPNGVTSIGSRTFKYCYGLTSINIPDGVTSIGNSAFEGCKSLTSINLPDGVTSIGLLTFGGCYVLTSIIIPDGVISIEQGAFWDCSSLTSIKIPEGVTHIGDNAFNGCENLEEVTYNATAPIEAHENVFGSTTYETATLNTPNATLAAVQATVPWNLFTHVTASDGSIGQTLPTPTANFANKVLTLSCEDTEASIRYTLDGTTPTSESALYEAPMALTQDCTVKFFAQRDRFVDSDVATFEFKVADHQVAMPGFAYESETAMLTISCATENAEIRYTTDGSEPTSTTGTKYEAPIHVEGNATYNARAFRSDLLDSKISSLTINDQTVPTPTASFGNKLLTLTCEDSEATIRYTLDGTTPTSESALYEAPVPLTQDCTVRFIAQRDNFNDSEVASFQFIMADYQVAKPVFAYDTDSHSVTITCATGNAEIRYTTDGSDPTATSGTRYVGQVGMDGNFSMNARAFRSDLFDSEMATLTISENQVPMPTASFANRHLTISCADTQATIHYTLDGTDPTEASAIYTAPLALTQDCTIKFFAVRAHYNDSQIGSFQLVTDNYRVATPTLSYNPVDASLTISCATENAEIRYTSDGSEPSATNGIVYEHPITFYGNYTFNARAFRNDLFDSEVASLVISGQKVTTPTASFAHKYLSLECSDPVARIVYTLDGSTPTTSSAVYTEPIAMTQDCTIKFMAVRERFINSDVAAYEFKVGDYRIESPTFTKDYAARKITVEHQESLPVTVTYGGVTQTLPTPATFDVTPAATFITAVAMSQDDEHYDSPEASETIVFNQPPVFRYDGHTLEIKASDSDPYSSGARFMLYVDGNLIEEGTSEISYNVNSFADVAAIVQTDNAYYSEPAETTIDYFNTGRVAGARNGHRLAECFGTWGDSKDSYMYLRVLGELNGADLQTLASLPELSILHLETDALEVDDCRGIFAGTRIETIFSNDYPQGMLIGMPRLTTVMWGRDGVKMPKGIITEAANPNILLWVADKDDSPEDACNVVSYTSQENGDATDPEGTGVSGHADKISLKVGYPYNAHMPIRADYVEVEKEFTLATEINVSAGWETLTLPFAPDSIIHETAGTIIPFNRWNVDDLNGPRPFWLYRAAGGNWEVASDIEAGIPYIISMPNCKDYVEAFNLAGKVKFIANDVTIGTEETSPAITDWKDGATFEGTFMPVEETGILSLNVNTTEEGIYPGSAFVADDVTLPFGGFVRVSGSRKLIPVFDGASGIQLPTISTDGLLVETPAPGMLRISSNRARNINIITPEGAIIRTLSLKAGESETAEGLTRGLYICAGVKVMVK